MLREKWPRAFPAREEDVRPLAIAAAHDIAAAMSWSLPYTLGVLHGWKREVYSRAVLRYDQRINLDGTPAEEVGATAKDLAAKQLARLAARKTAKRDAPAPPALMTPQPVPTPPLGTPPETPEQLRAKVRASLLRRSA